MKSWSRGLFSFLKDEKYTDILQLLSRLFNGDELGIELETNSKRIKLPVPKGKDDVLVVKRKNSK